MIQPRLIPCLLIHKKGLVKTQQFSDPKYVGDPLNAVRIFNEKEVDELIVLDIDASRAGTEPDYKQIQKLASECRMPLCYGGGVSTADQIERIVGLGVEKVAMSSAPLMNPEIVKEAARRVGSQSVVIVLDVKKGFLGRGYNIFIHNGSKKISGNFLQYIDTFDQNGAGEIVVNSIDCDGKMSGYDVELIRTVCGQTSLPVTALGGAASLEDIHQLYKRFGNIGAGVGSLFVFKGKYRAVLINYPNQDERRKAGVW
jgi:cyclase